MTQPIPLVVPRTILARGRTLMHQQCWLWGQDVRHFDGNLLLKFGFERFRPPADITASTQYSLSLSESLMVRLWGFGFAYGTREEQVYINRYDFRPRLMLHDSDRWEPPSTPLPPATDRWLFVAALRWIVSYERKIAKDQGKSYRNKLLPQWKDNRKVCQSPVVSWSQLADELAAARLDIS